MTLPLNFLTLVLSVTLKPLKQSLKHLFLTLAVFSIWALLIISRTLFMF